MSPPSPPRSPPPLIRPPPGPRLVVRRLGPPWPVQFRSGPAAAGVVEVLGVFGRPGGPVRVVIL